MADTYEDVETPMGSGIAVEVIDGVNLWIGCSGRFSADDLRDMADALDNFDPADRCSECGDELDGDGYDGRCGNCADEEEEA
jgi:hypothetical protein